MWTNANLIGKAYTVKGLLLSQVGGHLLLSDPPAHLRRSKFKSIFPSEQLQVRIDW